MAKQSLGADDEPIIELLDDEEMEATGYQIDISTADNDLRIQHTNEFGVLSSLVLDAGDAYEYAHRILRGYDKLEGL